MQIQYPPLASATANQTAFAANLTETTINIIITTTASPIVEPQV